MIKILLVDGEPSTRQYIANSINWQSFQASIVGEASNGEEAFFLSVKYSPDIIITDIELPICDGMELISRLRSIRSPAKIILLTEERGEEYLLKAIKLGVKEYLLKQSNISHIRVAIKKVCDQIIEEQEFSSSVQANKMLFQKHLHDIQADFMNRLLETNFQTDALEEEALRLNIHLCGPQYQMVLFHCNSEQYWNILTYLEQFSQKFHPCIWSTRHGSLHAILLNVKDPADTQSFVMNITKRYRHFFNSANQNFILTPPETSLFELSYHYKLGIRLSDCSMLFQEREVVFTKDFIQCSISSELSELLCHEKQLIYGLKTLDAVDYETQINVYTSALHSTLRTNIEIKNSLYRIIFGLTAKENLRISDVAKSIHEIDNINCMDRLRYFLASFYRRFGIAAESSSSLIQNTTRFVEEHFAEKISLNLIAKKNYVSASYLSNLFHRQTGISFNQWLNRYRIERAKGLLSTGKYKHYEIASMVGYTDYKTFAKYFSKYTGKNAREFKNQFVITSELHE